MAKIGKLPLLLLIFSITNPFQTDKLTDISFVNCVPVLFLQDDYLDPDQVLAEELVLHQQSEILFNN